MLKITDGRDHLYEWDTNRSLTAIDLPDLHHVDFVKVGYEPMTVVPVDNIVNIPNILLQNSLSIVCFIVSVDDKGTMTTSKQILRVEARQKPADYVYTETEIYTWEQFAAKQDEKLSKALAAEKAEVERIVSNLRDTKLDKPSTPPTGAGKILKVLSVNEDGTFTCEWADEPKSGGDYFEIKLDLDNMTCNHTASEVIEAYDQNATFVGGVGCLWPNDDNTATIYCHYMENGNTIGLLKLNEDKTLEPLYEDTVPISGTGRRFFVYDNDFIDGTYINSPISANEMSDLKELWYGEGPLFYGEGVDGFIYTLVNFISKSASSSGNASARFAWVGTTSVRFIELSGDEKKAFCTEREY